MSSTKVPGTLHLFKEKRVAFEFDPIGKSKALIFVGGLTDGLLTVPYLQGLAKALDPLGYSLVQIQITSSYIGFGTGSLKRDDEEIDSLVDYLKKDGREMVLLMGHSTGSQNTIHYLLHHPGKISGGILQAAVSDREFGSTVIPQPLLSKLNAEAKALVDAGKPEELLSSKHAECMLDTPITAYRWCSLLLPDGDDDFFSSDLSDEKLEITFGCIKDPFLIALSEKDECYPNNGKPLELLQRWQCFVDKKLWSKNSGLIKGATHAVPEEDSQKELFKMVTGFIKENGF